MSCYHPLIGIPTGERTENGKKKLIIKDACNLIDSYEQIYGKGYVLIPCGHCLGCRLDYSRKWADRMMLELETEKKGIFLTLTYDNEHCHWSKFEEDEFGVVDIEKPIYGTLNKRDWQLFMKSLRKEFAKDDLKLRFYASGEYGEKFLRPHMHAIIFGIGLADIGDCKPVGRNDIGQPYFVSEKIQKIWYRGRILVTDVSYETCAYVSRYVMKKLGGQKAEEYIRRNVIPEFSLMSRKPGIGSKYLEEHPDCLDKSKIYISTPSGGKEIPIPDYYIRKLELTDKKKFDKIKSARALYASDKMLLELQNQDLPFLDYLEEKEEKRKQQIKALRRKG